LLLDDILDADSYTNMAFTYQGMKLQPFCFQNLTAENSVTDVRCVPVAGDPWSMDPADADIMEKSGLLNKVNVYRGVGQGPGNGDGFGGHHRAVLENYFKSFPVFAEISL
jgi:hypothetical protein